MAKIKRRLKNARPPNEERNYTKIPNDSIDICLQSSIFSVADKCFFLIARNTLGFHRTFFTTSLDSIAKKIKSSKNVVHRALLKLEKNGLIAKKNSGNNTKKYQLCSGKEHKNLEENIPKSGNSIEENIPKSGNSTAKRVYLKVETPYTKKWKPCIPKSGNPVYLKVETLPTQVAQPSAPAEKLKKLSKENTKRNSLKKEKIEREFNKLWFNCYVEKAPDFFDDARKNYFALREKFSAKKISDALQNFILRWSSNGRTKWPSLSTVFKKHLQGLLLEKQKLTDEEWLKS